uniref:Uncharacterized protein n=1 Tax=Peronospora matthiolae TaxID=2874970 RepID=A0AAV1THH8_9STRA
MRIASSAADLAQDARQLSDYLPITRTSDSSAADAVDHRDRRADRGGGRHDSPVPFLFPEGHAVTAGNSTLAPRTLGSEATYTALDRKEERKVPQQVNRELLSRRGTRAGSMSLRANSSEDVLAPISSMKYDEKEKNGPRSCPATFANARATQTAFSRHKKRHQSRGGELIASKLQPTRDSVSNMLTYLHELRRSEASLRKQLVTTQQHTEDELNQSQSKLNKLQQVVQEVERDRKIAQQRLEEKEQRIRDLASRLEKAEAERAKVGSDFQHVFLSSDGLPSIAEEATSQAKTEQWTANPRKVGREAILSGQLTEKHPALTVEALPPQPHQTQPSSSPKRASYLPPTTDDVSQHLIELPRSPNQPLWDPWASGGRASVVNVPPVFTISSTGLEPLAATVTESAGVDVEDYELKSVLMSPHGDRCQPRAIHLDKHADSTAVPVSDQHHLASFEPLSSSPAFSNSPEPSSLLHPHQQSLQSREKQAKADEVQTQESLAAMNSSLRSNSVHRIGAMPSNYESNLKQPDDDDPSQDRGFHPGKESPDHQDIHERSLRPPLAAVNNDTPLSCTNHVTASSIEFLTQAPLQDRSLASAVSCSESDLDAKPDSCIAKPPADSPPQPLSTSKANLDWPSPSNQRRHKDVETEPVPLEKLLVDFFTEVDNKRLKMAKVYGKRYAGREKWLFAELTKRYGAAKVAALKARFDTGSGGHVFAEANCADGPEAQRATKSSDAPNHAEPGRRGSLQRPQVFHSPTPTSNAGFSDGAGATSVSTADAGLQVRGESRPQSRQVAAEVGTFPIPSESVSANPTSSQQRHSGGNMPSPSGSHTSFPSPQETGEELNAASVGDTGASSLKHGPFSMTQRGEPFGHRSFPPQTGTESGDASLGLRQRRQTSTCGQDDAAVTLESLLEELYKNHQPDKLKSVSTVAKQYAGKERELVVLLKGKYGALSVKRLEESLDVLERAHLARLSSDATGKRRGCFVRTISLLFWLSLLLFFSCGVVFISFVVLDVWECHSLDSEEQEPEGAEECSLLKEELAAFTYERVADYVGQSHPEACFCSEWKARESALFTNYSGEDIVNLARMVPFSPEKFGASWVATVKAQVPSQEFVDSYAKPVVDLSLDVGSFVWSSVLELAGSNKASEVSPIMGRGDDHDHSDISSSDEDDADSYQESAGVDNDDFAGNDGADALPRGVEELVEDPTVAMTPGVIDHDSPEKNTDALETRPVADELATTVADDVWEQHEDGIPVLADERDIDVVDDVSGKHEDVVSATADGLGTNVVEDVLVENEDVVTATTDGLDNSAADNTSVENENDVSIADDETFVGKKSSAFEMTEDLPTVPEPIDMLEVGDTVPSGVAESIDASEQAPGEETEAGTDVETTWGGSATTMTEDYEFAGGVDDALEIEIEVLDSALTNAADRATEKAPEVAAEDNEQTSTGDVAAEAESVVEVEVRQEGLGLSYPERESAEALGGNSAETSELPVQENVASLLGGGEELVTSSEETEVTPPVTNAVDRESAAHVSDSTKADVGMMHVELDDDAASEVSELDADTARVEGLENEESTEVSQVELSSELSPELSSEFEFVTHVSDPPSVSTGVDISVATSGADESTASSLYEGPEPDVRENELDNDVDAGAEFDGTPDDEKVMLFEDDGAGTLAFIETEQYLTNPNDVNADEVSPEEPTVYVSDDGSEAIEDDHEELTASALTRVSSSADSDGNVFEENAEAGNDELFLLAEVQQGSELDLEDDIMIVGKDTVAPDLSKDDENRDFGSTLSFEAEVASLEEATDEMDEVGDGRAGSTAHRDIEAEESASEADLVMELVAESAVAEGADAPDDMDTSSAELVAAVNENAEVDETVSAAAGKTTEGADIVSAADAPTHVTDKTTMMTEVGTSAVKSLGQHADEDDDDNEDEEVAFMLGLEDPGGLLRMAERAAAATVDMR